VGKDKKVLVIDDDVKTVELVKAYLKRDGYGVCVAYDGIEALRVARENKPDLVVLDLMLPGCDGLEVCRTLRQESDVPIIMLTAKASDEDKLEGYRLGADDYVTKPFSPRDLASRVGMLLKSLADETLAHEAQEVETGQIKMSFLRQEVSLNGRPVGLTPIEFRLLGVLLREPGRTFSRAQLIERVCGCDFGGFDRAIDVHILNLRRKLEKDPAHPTMIRTVHGIGYKFVC
jgi:DNA-binding response OmpR family regulator